MRHNPGSQRGDSIFSWRPRCLPKISHLLTLLLLSCGITLSMTSQVQAAPSSIADRGQHLASLLHKAMYVAAKNQGDWPQSISFVDQDAEKIEYVQPNIPANNQFEHWYLGSTVVLNEDPRFHRDGFWVGYLDGHIEFVRSAQEFNECKEQPNIIRDAVKRFGNPVDPPAQNIAPLPMPSRPLRVLVQDMEKQPVAGARIGTAENFGDYYPEAYRVIFPDGFSTPPPAPTFTNSRGEAFVPPLTFDPNTTRYAKSLASPLFVLDESRNLAAIDEVQRSEFGRATTHVVTLEPACKVTGHVTCYGLGAPGGQIPNTYAYVYSPGKFRLRGISSRSEKGTFEFLLPPGDFCIEIYGGAMNTYTTPRYVRIRPGARNIDLTIDLCPTVGATLRGKPAPELTEIKEWKNSPPLTLAGLHGKVILLDFWGVWCGQCMVEMKDLIVLHEQFKDQGLVIIGVHDASVQSMSAISASLARAKDRFWGGKDIPFPIALDSGGDEPISGTTLTTRGKTTATYGVHAFPTTLLIGRDGKVIREVNVTQPQLKAELQKLLAETPKNGGQQ